MSKHNAALVSVRTEWIKKRGLVPLFKGVRAINGDTLIQVKNYNFADHSFVELDFNPPAFKGRSVKVLIPRSVIEVILIPQKAKDVSLLGFKSLSENNAG
jgi:hypothetical protein